MVGYSSALPGAFLTQRDTAKNEKGRIIIFNLFSPFLSSLNEIQQIR